MSSEDDKTEINSNKSEKLQMQIEQSAQTSIEELDHEELDHSESEEEKERLDTDDRSSRRSLYKNHQNHD